MTGSVIAQAPTPRAVSLDVRGVPLDRALEQAATAAEISLVYEADLVRGHRSTCSIRDARPAALLRCILRDQPVDYVRASSGTYVLREAVRRVPQHGEITGVVRGAREGRPLPNAHVRLTNAHAHAASRAATDSTGRFRISGVLAGSHTLVVSYLGYERHEATVYLPPGGTARHGVRLASTSIATDSIVIDAVRQTATSARRSQARVPARELRQAGAAGASGIVTAASTLMGVSASAPYADLHIQGGDAGGHTLSLDGVPVRDPVSTGRLLGAFSPLALDGLTAHKAGFGALQGSALSGTIDLEHDLSGTDEQVGTVRIDPLSAEARVQGAASLGSTPVTAMAAGRVGIWNVYQDAALHDLITRWSTLDPVLAAAQMPTDTSLVGGSLGTRSRPIARFYDVHGAARFDLGPARSLYASAYHGGNQLGADLVLGQQVNTQGVNALSSARSSISVPTHDQYGWTNTVAQARYQAPVTARATGSLQASLSHYRGTSTSEMGPIEWTDEQLHEVVPVAQRGASRRGGTNAISEVGVKAQLDVALSSRSGLVVSVGAAHLSSYFSMGNAFVPRLYDRSSVVQLTSVAEATVGLGPHTVLEGGARLTALPSDAVYAEPRGSLRYHRDLEGLGTLALDLGGGLYRQFTSEFELNRDGATAVVPSTQVWLPITGSLSPPRTYHLAGTLAWQPTANWQVTLEGYRKWKPHLLGIDYPDLHARSAGSESPSQLSRFLASSHGSTVGGGLHVEHESAWVTTSLAYGYNRTRRTFPGRFDGRPVPVPWNEPHRLTLETELPLRGGLAVELRGEGTWGRPWGYRRAYYAYLTPEDLGADWGTIRLDRPDNHVLSPLYRLDAGLSIARSWGGIDVKGRIGVVNALNRSNVADWVLQPDGDGSLSRAARMLPGRRMSMSFQVSY